MHTLPLPALRALLARTPLLAPRLAALDTLSANVLAAELTVGVLGITSSGKSTLLNALMGEDLLPEESRPTTNVLVRCRRGLRRELEVRYAERPTEVLAGNALTAQRIAELCSETGNPGNRLGVVCLTWTSPRAVIPEGLVLVDTPGLDAYGHEDHEELTLRRFLPVADVVLYITTLQNPFKAADLLLVDALVEHDQRVLFALTRADDAKPEYDRGQLRRSPEQVIAAHLERLRRDVSRHTALETFGAVAISAKCAQTACGDRSHASWRESNLDALVTQLETLSGDLRGYAEESRARRVLALLTHARADVDSVLAAPLGQPPAPPTRLLALRGLGARTEKVTRCGNACRSTWKAFRERNRTTPLTLKGPTRASAEKCARALREEAGGLRADLLRALDAEQGLLRDWLGTLGIPVERARPLLLPEEDDLPVTDAHQTTTTGTRKVRGWFDAWAFWPKYEAYTSTVFDPIGYAKALSAWAKACNGAAASHVDWWEDYVTTSYLAPVQRALAAEEASLAALRTAATTVASERVALAGLRAEIDGALGGLAASVKALRAARATLGTDVVSPGSTSAAATSADAARFQAAFTNAWRSFLASATPRGKALPARIVLCGPRREAAAQLASLVAGDLALGDALLDLPEDAWAHVHEGAARAAHRPPTGPGLFLPPVDRSGTVRVTDADLRSFDLVGMEIDAVRPGSALSDVARSSWRGSLLPDRAFWFCRQGASLAGQLDTFLGQTLPLFQRGDIPDLPWFVLDGWDTRVTQVVGLFRELAAREGTPREFVRRWQVEGLELRAPFTEERLTQAFLAGATARGVSDGDTARRRSGTTHATPSPSTPSRRGSR